MGCSHLGSLALHLFADTAHPGGLPGARLTVDAHRQRRTLQAGAALTTRPIRPSGRTALPSHDTERDHVPPDCLPTSPARPLRRIRDLRTRRCGPVAARPHASCGTEPVARRYVRAMSELSRRVDERAAETDFAGVVHLERSGAVELNAAYGLADRGHGIPMTTDNQLGMASGSKTFTALAVMRLVEEGLLGLSTTARQVLGTDLPLIADDVTVEHLLSHRSGIGDYLDEDELDSEDYLMPVSVHRLVTTEDFLPILDGCPTKFPAGARFTYCNGGFVVLALIAERVSSRSYQDLVRELVCSPRAWPTLRSCAPMLFPGGRHWATSRSGANGGPTSSTCLWSPRETVGCTRPPPTWLGSGPH